MLKEGDHMLPEYFEMRKKQNKGAGPVEIDLTNTEEAKKVAKIAAKLKITPLVAK